jgi:predicted PurR-regulated permease PerM
VEALRTVRVKRKAAVATERQQMATIADILAAAARPAIVGIFLLLLVAALYLARPILLPILAALIVGMTFAPLVKRAAQAGVSPVITATGLVTALVTAAAIAVTLLSAPIIAWIGRAPEIAEIVKQKLYVLDWPLAALRDLQSTLMPPSPNTVVVEPSQMTLVAPVVAAVTPAVAQLVIFSATLLFFLISQVELRRQFASLFASRDAKLRFIRIANEIESSLAMYVAVVTGINFALGAVVAFGAWLFGLPNPLVLGVVAAVLNFIPYIGPAVMIIVLFAVGLITYPTLGYALLPPLAFLAATTIEGQFVTPAVLGRQLTMNPLIVFIALVFWAWLWGPIGAFLAVPLFIVALVVFSHVLPSDEAQLPD